MRWLLVLALVGCSAGSTWTGWVAEDAWSTPPGIPLQLRVSRFARPNTITAVALPPGAEAPTGPADAGTRLPVVLQGVACEVSVVARTTDTVERSRPTTEVRRTTPAGPRTLRGLMVEVACGDQPVPGTDASWRGARSRTSVPWGVIPLALGIMAGVILRRDRYWTAVLIGVVSVVGGAVLGVVLFDSLFAVTYALLFAGLGALGIIGMRGDTVALRVAAIGGGVAGTVIAPLVWPLWTGFGPVMALILGAAVGIAALIPVVMRD